MPSQHELRDIAKELKIRGYSRMKKAELEEAISQQLKGLNEETVPVAEKPKPSKEELLKELEASKAEAKKPAPAEKIDAFEKAASTAKERKPSAWHDYVRAYAKENGLTYKQAMSAAGPSYHEKKAKKETV